MEFLKKGLFEKDFMQTKITTHSMSFKEKALGYAIGPGFIAVYTCMLTSLREMFYLSVIPVDKLFGAGTYMSLQTVSTILGTVIGLLFSYVVERTVSRAGRFRPYVLMGAILMALCGIGMFWTPFEHGATGELVWLWFFNLLYFGFAVIMFGQRVNMISVSSRNLKDRNFVTVLRTSMENMIPGVFGAVIITGWLYFVFLVNDTEGTNWRICIILTAVVAIIAAIIEYFYTRERITEDNRSMNTNVNHEINRVPIGKQLKALLTNKYYLLATFLTIGFTLACNLQGANARTYFCQWILGANDTNGLAVIYLMLAMQPMALGPIVVPILARKIGARKLLMISCVIVLAGIGVCMINPYDFGMACAGGFLFSFGSIGIAMQGVISQQAADMVEFEHGFRVEGTLATAIIAAVYSALIAPFSGLYETVLANMGFDAYAASQPAEINNWILFAYYGSYAIQAIVIFAVLIFFNAEKRMPEVLKELRRREKEAVEARGEVWVDPEEAERLQWEEAERLAEENRIADLKEKCQKKGLDFDKENEKYLKKMAKKKAKKEKKNK